MNSSLFWLAVVFESFTYSLFNVDLRSNFMDGEGDSNYKFLRAAIMVGLPPPFLGMV